MSSYHRSVRVLSLRWVLCASIPALVLSGIHKHYKIYSCRLYRTLPAYSGCDVNECRVDSEAFETKGELDNLDDGEKICHITVEIDATDVSIVVPTRVVPAAGETCANTTIKNYMCKKVGDDNSEAKIMPSSRYDYRVQNISAMSCNLQDLKIDDRFREYCGIELIIPEMGKQYLGRYECTWQPEDTSKPPLKFRYKLSMAEFSCSNCFGRDPACKVISLPETPPTSQSVPLDDLMKPMEIHEHYIVKVGQPFCLSVLGVSDKPHAKGGSFYFSNSFTHFHQRALQRPLGNHTLGSIKVDLLRGVIVYGGFHNCLRIASMMPELAGVYQYYYITDAGEQLAVTIKISVAAPDDLEVYVVGLAAGLGLLLMVITLVIFILCVNRARIRTLVQDDEEEQDLIDYEDETPLEKDPANVDEGSNGLKGRGRQVSPADSGQGNRQDSRPPGRWRSLTPNWLPFRGKRDNSSSRSASPAAAAAGSSQQAAAGYDADRSKSSSDGISPPRTTREARLQPKKSRSSRKPSSSQSAMPVSNTRRKSQSSSTKGSCPPNYYGTCPGSADVSD